MHNNKSEHEVKLSCRKHLEVGGIYEVISFDDEGVCLRSGCGQMNIEGNNLKMSVLDTDRGVVVLDGSIDSIYYYDDKSEEKRGFLGRIFG